MQKFFARFKVTIIWGIVIAFIVSSMGLYFLMRQPPEAADAHIGRRIAVVINDEQIAIGEFEAAHAHLIRQHEQFHARRGEPFTPLLQGVTGALLQLQLRAHTMEGLIRHTLRGQEITRQRIRVDSRVVEAEFLRQYDELLRVHNLTEEQLREVLAEHGQTLREFKENVIRTPIRREMEERELRAIAVGTIIPTDAALKAFMDENIGRYKQQEEVQASHILVADEELATEILTKLREGADFTELAQEHSTCPSAAMGGDLGRFGRGRMVREFEIAAFGLAVGAISEVTPTQFGYHIITLTDHWPAHLPTLDEIKDDVTADFILAEEQRKFEYWLEELRNAATVEIKLPLVAAQLLYQQHPLLGLAEFKRIRDERVIDDPHLGFFIGQIYEARWREVIAERGDLEAKEERTPEEESRLAELIARSAHYHAIAVANYEQVLQVRGIELDERFLRRIHRLAPDSAVAVYHLGRLLQERGDPFGADRHFRDAISIDPSFLPAIIATGEIALEQRFYHVAIEYFQRALELRPDDVRILINLGQAYIEVGELDRAEEALTVVLQQDPRNPRALTGMGNLSYNRLQSAIESADRLQRRSDLTAEEEKELSKLQDAIEDYGRKTINYYQLVMEITPSIDLELRIGMAQLAIGSIEEAKLIFEGIIRRAPFTGEAFHLLGEIYLQRDDAETALAKFRIGFDRTIYRSIALDPEKAALRLALGREIIKLAPDDIEIRFRVARVYEDHFMWKGAIRHYTAILELDPTSIPAHREMANAHLQRAEHDIAQQYLWLAIPHALTEDEKLSIYQQIIDIERANVGRGAPLGPSGLDAQFAMAEIHIARANINQAQRLLAEIQADDPDHRAAEVQGLLAKIAPVEEDRPAPEEEGTENQSGGNGE